MSKISGKEKLNIAMIGHKRIPSREGGVEIVVEELATRMVGLGHSVTCYNRGGHNVAGSEYDTSVTNDYKGVKVKKVWTIDKKGLAAVTASISASVCAAFGKYDVVHYHAEGPCIGCFIPKLFGKRVVATIHGLDHKRAKWGKIAGFVIMKGEKNAVKYADEIIVLSQGVQQYFMDTYGRETVFLPNGVCRPDREEADIITKRWELNKNDYILYLGRLVPEKGAHYLIDAYKAANIDKKLVIAGGISDSSEYLNRLLDMVGYVKDKDDKGVIKSPDGRIILTGFVQGNTLAELYSNAYLYVLPSDLEGMPLSLMEAMSYGNCCVTSDIEECIAVTDGHGYAFKAGDDKELGELLLSLCDDSDGVEAVKNTSADYICDKYNWDNITKDTLDLYTKKA